MSSPLPVRAARAAAALPLFALVLAAAPTLAVTFRIPIEDPRFLMPTWVVGVDHDGDDSGSRDTCLDYAGRRNFPFCYNAHDGTDFMLMGGFETMDRGVALVVAAANGVVTAAEDGHYDRCHVDAASGYIDCDGNEMRANYVRVRHADGTETAYYHLKNGSVQVAVGDEVRCGDGLGLVGSSGISSIPHLHFQVESADGATIDPYAGPESQPESFWVEDPVAPNLLPAAYCEGEVVPGPDVVAPGPDVVETPPDAGDDPPVPAADVPAVPEDVAGPPVDPPVDAILGGPDTGRDVREGLPPTPLPDAGATPDAGGFELTEEQAGALLSCSADPSGAGAAAPTALLLLTLGVLVVARRIPARARRPRP